MTRNMVYVEISDFFDERQPRYDHSKNDLKYTPSGAILEWFWGGAPAAPREGLGSNSIWLWTYPMGTWSPMIPKQSYQIWPFPATVWGTHGSRLKCSFLSCCLFPQLFESAGNRPPFHHEVWPHKLPLFCACRSIERGKSRPLERDAAVAIVALSKTCTFEIAWKEVIHFGHSENGFFLFVKVLFWVPF